MKPRNDSFIVDSLSRGWFDRVIIKKLFGYPDPESCWIWTGRQWNGYGVAQTTKRPQKQVRAHRVVWIALRGPIGDELVLDHDGPHGCSNRLCCNPNHLQAVTHRHNTVVTGTGPFAEKHKQTHCKRGHPLIEGNLIPSAPIGGRRCLECSRLLGRLRGNLFSEARSVLGMTRSEYIKTFGGMNKDVAQRVVDIGRSWVVL